MGKPLVSVAEWKPLVLPASLDTGRVRDRVMRAGETSLGSAFSQRAQTIKARGLVGLVNTSDIDIQVIPKLYADDDDPGPGTALLRTLIGIELSFPHHLTFASAASLKAPFLELVIGHLARMLLSQLQEGLPRRYHEKTEELSVIRGRIDLQHQARQMPSYAHRIRVRHAPLQRDNPLSQLCKAAAFRLADLTATARNRRLLSESLALLDSVTTVPLSAELQQSAAPGPLEAEWQWLYRISDLLLSRRSPDLVSAGDDDGVAIVFPLDGLFEGLIRRAVDRGIQGASLSVSRSKAIGKLFHRPVSETGLIDLRPDLVIRKAGVTTPCGVGDAKWKRQKVGQPLAPDRSDAFQLLTYMSNLGLRHGFLCYPSSSPIDGGCRVEQVQTTKSGAIISLIEVDVAQLAHPELTSRSKAEAALGQLVIATCLIDHSAAGSS